MNAAVLTKLINYVRGKLKPVVGVHLDSDFIKILALSQGKNAVYKIEAYQNMDLKKIFLAPNILHKLKTLRAAIALPASATFYRIIQMNKALTDDEIAEQIEVEAHRIIPYPLEEVYFDFEIIGPSDTHIELVDILFVASKIETLKTHIQQLSMLGFEELSVGIVDLESLALERAFKWLAYQLPERGINQRIVLLNMNHQSMTFQVFYNFKTVYNRDHSILQGHDLVEQLQRALQQFRLTETEHEIHALVLAGALLTKPEIISKIETAVGIHTLIANPFHNKELNIVCAEDVDFQVIKNAGPSLVLALGLALRNFDI